MARRRLAAASSKSRFNCTSFSREASIFFSVARAYSVLLADLDEGDLKYKVDFKNVYATILNKWLKANDKEILAKQYEYLNFI